jgi:hypothetical protein
MNPRSKLLIEMITGCSISRQRRDFKSSRRGESQLTRSFRPKGAPAGAAVREHADNAAFGYAYDGGFMAPTGIPAGKIGTPTATPIDFTLGLRNFPYIWVSPPDPGFVPLSFDFDKDLGRLNKDTPFTDDSTVNTPSYMVVAWPSSSGPMIV